MLLYPAAPAPSRASAEMMYAIQVRTAGAALLIAAAKMVNIVPSPRASASKLPAGTIYANHMRIQATAALTVHAYHLVKFAAR